MYCKQFEERLDNLLDHRLSPDADAALQTHACQCDSCRLLLEYQSQLFAALDQHTVTIPSADFAARVVTRCTETDPAQERSPVRVSLHPGIKQSSETVRKSQSKWRYLLTWATVTAAAGLLFVPLTWPGKSKPGTNSGVAQRSHLQTPASRKQQPFTHFPSSQKQTTDGSGHDVTSHHQSTHPIPMHWLKNPAGQVSHRIGSWANDLSRQSRALVQLTGGLRPITSSFTVTWKALRRTIPTMRSEPSSPQSSIQTVAPTA